MCFFIIIATCLYFFTIFYFFENISVIDNGPERNEYVNSNFVHYHTSMLLLRISLQRPVSLEHDLPSRLNLPWLVAVWGFESATLEVSEWSLKPPCVVAVPGRCFFFYDCSCYSTFNLMFSIQRRVWMYVLCCLHRLSGIYLFALSFYSIWTGSNFRQTLVPEFVGRDRPRAVPVTTHDNIAQRRS